MADDMVETRPEGAVAQVKEKGAELASSTQEHVSTKAHELAEDAGFQLREQVDQRSTHAGEQFEAVGTALQSGVEKLRTEGNEVSAKMVAEFARRAEDLGGYLKSTQADEMFADVERFARRRPWLTAGLGVLGGFVASRFVKASADRRYAEQRADTSGTAYQARASLPSGVGT